MKNKLVLSFLFIIPIIIVVAVYLAALKPWEPQYASNGPLVVKKGSAVESTNVKIGEGVIFSGKAFNNKTDKPIQIVKIQMANDVTNQSATDISFKEIGMSTQNIGAVLATDLNKYKVEKLPFEIPAGSNQYLPIVEMTAHKAGLYTLEGIIVTYKYDGKLYRDYIPDRFTIRCETNIKAK